MSAKHGRLESLITVPSGGWVVAIQGGSDGSPLNATVAAGTYYMTDLYAAVQTACNATATLDTWTVTWANGEDATGKVTIAATGGNYTATWTDSDLRDCLGFETDGTLSGAATNTSTDQAKHCWFPDGPHETEYGPNDDGWKESDLRATESPGGNAKFLAGNSKTVNWIRFNGISRAKCRIAGETVGNESFEQFHNDAVLGNGPGGMPGAQWKWYWDADVATALNCTAHGLEMWKPEKLAEGWIEQWRITVPRLVKVPA